MINHIFQTTFDTSFCKKDEKIIKSLKRKEKKRNTMVSVNVN